MNFMKLSWIFLLLLGVVSSSYAKDEEWTDPEICVAIANNFDKAALVPLFDGQQPDEVIVRGGRLCYKSGCLPRCGVDLILANRGSLGGVMLYRQGNAYQIFIENKKHLADTSDIVNVNLFPWVAEGFYYFKEGNTFQEYFAYTKTGDYLIISYSFFKLHDKPFRNQQPSTKIVDNEFKTFIGIIGSQLY